MSERASALAVLWDSGICMVDHMKADPSLGRMSSKSWQESV